MAGNVVGNRKGCGVVLEGNQILESFHELTEMEIKLLQLCLAGIYQVEAIDRNTYYEIDKIKYAEVFGLTEAAAYEAMTSACKTLMTRTLTIKSTLLGEDAPEKAKTIIHWVHSCRYNGETGKVELKWHDSILHLLCQFSAEEPYSKYHLDDVCKLKSIHAIRLYRLLNRWANLKYKIWAIEDFRYLMGFTEVEYKVFNNLRAKVIEPALEAINLYTNLTAEVDFKTKGMKKTHVIFTITKSTFGEKEVSVC